MTSTCQSGQGYYILLLVCLNWKDTPGNGVWKKEVLFFVCFFHLSGYTYISFFLLLVSYQRLLELFIPNVIIYYLSIDCSSYSISKILREHRRAVTERAVPSGP